MIEEYINKHTIMGMMSKNYIPREGWKGFYKNKNKTKVVVFDEDFVDQSFHEINYYYIKNKPECKNKYYSTLLVSFFGGEYFKLEGKSNTEIRETKNKWNKRIVIKEEIKNIEEVINLIKEWDIYSGKKYRWNKHSGYDKNFFIHYYNQEKDNLFSLFFYYENKLIGYSIVSKESNDLCFRYVIRKMNILAGRNICLYIDYKTFENLYRNTKTDFYINWGASSGNVLKYKKKFPVFLEKKVWFYKVKNSQLPTAKACGLEQ